jgi:putative hemin transport protein
VFIAIGARMCSQVIDIRQSFASLRLEKKLRHREISGFLGITEAQLIDAHVGISKLTAMKSSPHLARAIRFKKPYSELIFQIEGLGEVLALTRNEYGVHEKVGIYQHVSKQGDIGVVHGDLIDLRLFYKHWEFAYAFEEGKGDALQRSIQFFDEYGTAIHKIFLLPTSDHEYFEQLVDDFSDMNQDSGIQVQEKLQDISSCNVTFSEEFSLEKFRHDWSQMSDSHEFFDLLKKHGLNRLQALQCIGNHYAQPLTQSSMRQVFESAKEKKIPLMIFVGNRGAIQIHTGIICRVVEAKAWFNILDPGFNLHLDIEKINQIWLVRKPSKDGVVTSVELLDGQGEMIALVFGERHLGEPELAAWRHLVEETLDDQTNQELSMVD